MPAITLVPTLQEIFIVAQPLVRVLKFIRPGSIKGVEAFAKKREGIHLPK